MQKKKKKKKAKDQILPYVEIKNLIRQLTPEQMEEAFGGVVKTPACVPTKSPAEIFTIEEAHKLQNELGYFVHNKVERAKDYAWLSLSEAERTILAIWELESEVNNGGFDQYFFNSSGDHAFEVVDALNRVGAKAFADIARRAISAFPSGCPSEDRETRWKEADKIDKKARPLWSELDGEFLNYAENLADLVAAYIRKNRSEFVA